MFEFHPPQENFKGDFLDELLGAGWFRMGERMFTTDNVINDRDEVFGAHWLRYDVLKINSAFYNKRNYKKLRGKYTLECKPLHEVDKEELEALFALYRQYTKFEESDSLGEILGEYSDKFDTHIILVRDMGMLIAAGTFDMGYNSMAAIKNIYHPAYAPAGLGIFLLMEEIKHCQDQGLQWFYPGYIAPGYPNFDYKIYPSFSEVFIIETGEWVPYEQWAQRSVSSRG